MGEGMLSPETLAVGAFTSCQVRVYDGDEKAETNLHTDTRVGVDAKTGNLKEVDQLPNTDVAIYTIGDAMLLWRKPYERSEDSDPWPPSYPLVPLEDGSLFVWKTGPGSDDWTYKHGVFWPRATDPCYKGPWAGQRRIAFVFRCTRPQKW